MFELLFRPVGWDVSSFFDVVGIFFSKAVSFFELLSPTALKYFNVFDWSNLFVMEVQ